MRGSNRKWLAGAVVLLVCSIAPAPSRDPAAASGKQLASRIMERLESDRRTLRDYIYTEAKTTEKWGRDGRLSSRTLELNEFFYRDGRRWKRNVLQEPLPSEWNMDDGPTDRSTSPADRSVDPERLKAVGEPPFALEALFACFRFYPLGPRTPQGDETLRIAFTPVDGCRGSGGYFARVLERLSGEIWVDPESFDVLWFEGRLRRPVTFGFGLLGKLESFEVALSREPVGPDLYATTRIEYRARGRTFLTHSFDHRARRERTDFRRYSPDHQPTTTSTPNRPPA